MIEHITKYPYNKNKSEDSYFSESEDFEIFDSDNTSSKNP